MTGPAADRLGGKKIILAMAKDNSMWRHRRIQVEMVKLGHPIASSTVWEILDAAGTDPAPRRSGPVEKQFLTTQAHGTRVPPGSTERVLTRTLRLVHIP